MRASRLEPAMDETVRKRLQEYPIPAHHGPFIKRNRNLLAGEARPIANRCGCKDNHDDPKRPSSALPYGWPQCGQTVLPSMRFFLQLGHTTSFTSGRVAKWTISPT